MGFPNEINASDWHFYFPKEYHENIGMALKIHQHLDVGSDFLKELNIPSYVGVYVKSDAIPSIVVSRCSMLMVKRQM